MWNTARLVAVGTALSLGAVVSAGCASDESGPVATSTESTTAATDVTAATEVDADQSGTSDEVAMTIEALCNPLDDAVATWLGADAESQHLDLFAADGPASIVCEWQVEPDYREVRVVYQASPAVWDATVAAGGESLGGVEADNRYDGEILSVHASNDWTVDVIAYEGDPPTYAEVPDVVASIANAALAALATG